MLLPVVSVLDSCQEHHVVLADIFLLANRHLVTLVIKHGLKHAVWIQVFLTAEGHRCKEVLQLANEFHARVNQPFIQSIGVTMTLASLTRACVLSSPSNRTSSLLVILLKNLHLEGEDAADKFWQCEIDLQQ